MSRKVAGKKRGNLIRRDVEEKTNKIMEVLVQLPLKKRLDMRSYQEPIVNDIIIDI